MHRQSSASLSKLSPMMGRISWNALFGKRGIGISHAGTDGKAQQAILDKGLAIRALGYLSTNDLNSKPRTCRPTGSLFSNYHEPLLRS